MLFVKKKEEEENQLATFIFDSVLTETGRFQLSYGN